MSKQDQSIRLNYQHSKIDQGNPKIWLDALS